MITLQAFYNVPRRILVSNFASILHGAFGSDLSPRSVLESGSIDNPILSSTEQEFDEQPDFVADPFVLPGTDEVFFEMFSKRWSPTAKIGWGEISGSFDHIEFNGIALEEDHHLSFPYVFNWEGEKYMIPDIWDKNGNSPTYLYRMGDSETEWKVVNEIIPENPLHDVILIYLKNRWWAIGAKQNKYLHIYHSENLLRGNWEPHADNPVRVSSETARPAGRPVQMNGETVLFFQDCSRVYGECVKATKLRSLSVDTFDDTPIYGAKENFVGPGTARLGWNSGRMHHIDLIGKSGEEYWFITDGAITTGSEFIGGPHWSIGVGRLPVEYVSREVSQVF